MSVYMLAYARLCVEIYLIGLNYSLFIISRFFYATVFLVTRNGKSKKGLLVSMTNGICVTSFRFF